jgi:hypothetical protein
VVTASTPLALVGLGLLLGLRHALDVDHLAAVWAIVSERGRAPGSWLVGALWGLGHTAALLGAGVAVVGLGAEIPPGLARALELAVALMLVGLGLRLLRTLRAGGRLHHHVHAHGGRLHAHPHLHRAGMPAGPSGHHPVGAAGKPFLVGLVHGLAGSAGLMLAVLATIADRALALLYVGAFGCGSIGGMVAMSALLGAPIALVGRLGRAEGVLRALAGAGSVGVGLALAWRVVVEAGVLA